MYLLKAYDISSNPEELVELPRDYHVFPKAPPGLEKDMEWDGVLYIDRHLYLVEAKTALESGHITTMRERMERTVRIIKLCKSGKLPVNGAKKHVQMLCAQWAQLADAVKVYGVVGGVGFTQHMLHSACKEGLMCVVPKGEVYEIQPPLLGVLVSVESPNSGGVEGEVAAPLFENLTISDEDLIDYVEEVGINCSLGG